VRLRVVLVEDADLALDLRVGDVLLRRLVDDVHDDVDRSHLRDGRGKAARRLDVGEVLDLRTVPRVLGIGVQQQAVYFARRAVPPWCVRHAQPPWSLAGLLPTLFSARVRAQGTGVRLRRVRPSARALPALDALTRGGHGRRAGL